MTVMEFIGPLLTEDQTRAMMERSRESWGSRYATEGALAVKDYALAELGLTEIVSFTCAGMFLIENLTSHILRHPRA